MWTTPSWHCLPDHCWTKQRITSTRRWTTPVGTNWVNGTNGQGMDTPTIVRAETTTLKPSNETAHQPPPGTLFRGLLAKYRSPLREDVPGSPAVVDRWYMTELPLAVSYWSLNLAFDPDPKPMTNTNNNQPSKHRQQRTLTLSPTKINDDCSSNQDKQTKSSKQKSENKQTAILQQSSTT